MFKINITMTAFRRQIRSLLSAERVSPTPAQFGAISGQTYQESGSRSVFRRVRKMAKSDC